MQIVDTHAHIYSEDETRYPKIDNPLHPPPGKGTIEHLREEVQTNGVARVVIVQTGTAYRFDNRFTVDVVKANRDWTVGVCLLDPDNPESPDLLLEYAKAGIKGVRVIGWGNLGTALIHEGHRRLWETAAQTKGVVCALLNPPHCAQLARLLEKYPEVPVVLDHCANLSASDGPDSDNFKAVLELARYPNLYPKVSMIVTGSQQDYPCCDMHNTARRIIERFGPERCMWGSDFPCELWIPKVTYGQHLSLFTEQLGLNREEQTAILETTPMKLWFDV